ncbi:unnamed protein product, partial [Vitrella brassicaformis CCMP3155]
ARPTEDCGRQHWSGAVPSIMRNPLVILAAILLTVAVLPGMCTSSSGTTQCRGESRSDGHCGSFDFTHSVCAHIKNTDFFAMTGQYDWSDEIKEPGYWCICIHKCAQYVDVTGSLELSIDCEATDWCNVCTNQDGGQDTSECTNHLLAKCGKSRCRDPCAAAALS